MTRIVYIHTGYSTFVEKDLVILKKHYSVKEVYFKLFPKWKIPFRLVALLLSNIFSSRKTIFVSQFAGFHTIVPGILNQFLGTKNVLILGGTDCVKFGSIDYGNFNRNLLGRATAYSMRHASLLLPVHDSLIEYDYSYNFEDGPKQGYQAHVKNRIETPVKVIYNGYDASKWNRIEKDFNKFSFITIAGDLSTRFGAQLKGIDLIMKTALLLPEAQFYIVGGERLPNKTFAPNIHYLGNYPNNELVTLLNDKPYYLQLSMSEGFPNALCEAILNGCLPIVSNVGAMPFIVQDKRLIVHERTEKEVYNTLSAIMQIPDSMKKELQESLFERIRTTFTLEYREKELVQAIENLN